MSTPRGYDAALEFYKTKRIPLGSWANWLAACYDIVEKHYAFMCSWPMLVGMSVGMFEKRPASRVEFRRSVRFAFNRPAEQRFLVYFVALIDALSGGDRDEMLKTFRGDIGRTCVRRLPGSVFDWPDTAAGTIRLLESIRPISTAFPRSRDGYANTFPQLVYGYYVTTRSPRAIRVLYAYALNNPQSTEIASILSHDKSIAEYFAAQ